MSSDDGTKDGRVSVRRSACRVMLSTEVNSAREIFAARESFSVRRVSIRA